MRAAAAAVLVLVLALPTAAAQPRRATLELGTLAPLTIRGRGFGRSERVALTASAPNAQRKVSVLARPSGSFTARFELGVSRCTSLTVRAVGTRGSRAILQLEPGCKEKKPKKRRGPG
ncbi:MAG TPA: hypothetical protein VM049_04605 [Gaiellaceae bacterium]|nr:hypothetical protein [Gaiellaceae bacterium]